MNELIQFGILHVCICNIRPFSNPFIGFSKLIGAIDCTHVPINAPLGEHEADFVNRKSTHRHQCAGKVFPGLDHVGSEIACR